MVQMQDVRLSIVNQLVVVHQDSLVMKNSNNIKSAILILHLRVGLRVHFLKLTPEPTLPNILTDNILGIPRNGSPDPQHGCVRTPVSCGNSSSTCTQDYSCVRDVCLQQCSIDTDCALGERSEME